MMKSYQFRCVLLADVVVTSDTATEGVKESLDYIPGSKFLGITAKSLYPNPKDYGGKQDIAQDLFHNGTVRFGDALPQIGDDEIGFRIPFSWYHAKGKSLTEGVYLNHNTSEGLQLKQQRNGYITLSGKWLKKVDQHFSIKSAYDIEKRRSKDSQMHGYFALPKGSTWTFTVEDDTGNYINKVKEVLEGRHRIGRSRSAQYGLVEISFMKEVDKVKESKNYQDSVLLYAKSNLVFYNYQGQTTVTPDPVNHLGLPTRSRIDWSKSQVRSRVYQTWNRYRHNRDADRLIIEKGSVLFCHLGEAVSLNDQLWVGSHKNEGFGEVLINPSFLTYDLDEAYRLKVNLQPVQEKEWINIHSSSLAVEKMPGDKLLLDYLKKRQAKENAVFSIDSCVNKFIEENMGSYQGLTPSQWGMVRNYAKHAANAETLKKLLFGEVVGCLMRGKTEEQWRRKERREKLRKILFAKDHGHDPIQLAIRIATEMPKRNK